MLKTWFVTVIGPHNYIRYVTFLTDLYRSACLPFNVQGRQLIQHHLIPTGGTVLDIGANTGRFTAFVAPLVGKSGRVYSFEPVPMAFRVLKWVVALRRFQQVRVIEAALAAESGEAEITIPLREGWRPLVPIAHLGGQRQLGTRQELVQVKQLDEFCLVANIDHIDFIKCDTEGYEYFVFIGAQKTLARDRPSIFCEIEKPYTERQNLDPSALFDLFETLGYASYLPTADERLLPVDGYQQRGDYFFIHPSKLTPELKERLVETKPSGPIES